MDMGHRVLLLIALSSPPAPLPFLFVWLIGPRLHPPLPLTIYDNRYSFQFLSVVVLIFEIVGLSFLTIFSP